MKTLAAYATEGEIGGEDWGNVTALHPNRTETLADCVRSSVADYLRHMDGHDVHDLHRLFMDEVERPLLETILQHTHGNQTLAAKLLGLSRSTLRKRLGAYHIGDES